MAQFPSAFAPKSPEYLALRFSKWGTPEARKFYWTMEPKTVVAIASAEQALFGSGKHVYGSWQLAMPSGIVWG